MEAGKSATVRAISPTFKTCLLINLIAKDLEQIVSKVASHKGFEAVCVQFFAHEKPLKIQIQIRNKNSQKEISIKDCESLSIPISEALDHSELIKQSFVLEVSSPGISDLLTSDKDFNTFKGFPIEAICIKKNKEKLYKVGLLHEMSGDQLRLNNKGKISNIPRDEVLQVRLRTPSG
tara:strand:+ start:1599 stop:2129 length:531 start_codon:yes stop_codon:yes gene_type:complete